MELFPSSLEMWMLGLQRQQQQQQQQQQHVNKYLQIAVMLTLAVISYGATASDERCRFPREWKGRWYQSGLGEVIIREKNILQKGSCYEHHRDYFLIENREEDCFQCLLIMKRHRNIIQYKESFCVGRDSLRNICAQIRIETQLYTLVREPSSSIKCPFADAYYFDYNDQGTGYCNTAISYAQPCVGQRQYQMHFKHCVPYAVFNNEELQFECLATWKDGSDKYLYGRFSGAPIATKDEEYRCFLFQYYGSEMYMAMSADATCRGLRSPKDGPLTMQFSEDIFGWPPPSCRFPEWLSYTTWRDVEGKHTYLLDDRGEILQDFYRRRITAKEHLNSEFKCLEILDQKKEDGKEEYVVLSFATHTCLSKHQCLKLVKRDDGILEFHQGSLADYETSRRCLQTPDYTHVQLLLAETPAAVPCPLPGRYAVQSPADCPRDLSISCAKPTSLTLFLTCQDPVAELTCVATWQADDSHFFLAMDANSDSRLINCFVLKERDGAMQLTTSKKCSNGAANLLDEPLRLTLLSRETCNGSQVLFTADGAFMSALDDAGSDGSPDDDADDGGGGEDIFIKDSDEEPPPSKEASIEGYTTQPAINWNVINDGQNQNGGPGYDVRGDDQSSESDVTPTKFPPIHIDTGQEGSRQDDDREAAAEKSSNRGSSAGGNVDIPSYNADDSERSSSQGGPKDIQSSGISHSCDSSLLLCALSFLLVLLFPWR